ncbi:hypothetical protein [Methylobacterium oryzisoli]|uniref:hypothetical protein n=1 Tax=Methylobacterium oryzisoli TaxID=3385502 RepID=UPI00389220DC
MSLRLNLAIASLSAFGVVSVCAVSAVQLERSAAAPPPLQVAAAPAPVGAVASRQTEEPAATGSISPVPVPTKPRAQGQAQAKAKTEPKRDPAFDSERLAALLSAAAAGTAKPVGR